MNTEAYFSNGFALIHIHGRWHFCILKMNSDSHIDTLNFVNPSRLEELKKNFFKSNEPVESTNWNPEFKKEVETKILNSGEAYRKFLESDFIHLVVGYTTDTLTAVPNTPERIDPIVEAIQELMEKGNSSAYLRFSF